MTAAKPPTRSEFIAEARRRIGNPVNASGAQDCGSNCLGFFVGLARALGGLERLVAAAEPHVGFAKPPSRLALLRGLREHMDQIPIAQATTADLILYNVDGQPRHLALVTEPGIILHADARLGVVEHRIPSDWRPAAAFRIPEMT